MAWRYYFPWLALFLFPQLQGAKGRRKRSFPVEVLFSLGVIIGSGASIARYVRHRSPKSVTLIMGGDLMGGRTLNTYFQHPKFDYMSSDFRTLVEKSDGVICNLEMAITDREEKTPKTFNFKMATQYKAQLKAGHVKYVSLANNHIRDFKIAGMQDTLQALDQLGILHAGAGNTKKEAAKPAILEINGLRIGCISLADHYADWAATATSPGIYFMEPRPTGPAWEALKKEIKALKAITDCVIVSLHWNSNYVKKIEQSYIAFAHALIDAGVHIIHGHSPHHVLPVERYRGGMIFYSLGAYVDDYAVNAYRNNLSFVAQLIIEKSEHSLAIHAAIIPIKIQHGSITTQLAEEEKDFIRKNTQVADISNFTFTF